MSDLKPCQCGSTKLDYSLKVSSRNYTGKSIYHCAVYCKDCHAYGTRVLCYSDEPYRLAVSENKEFKEQAKEAWNNRPVEDRLTAQLEVAREALMKANATLKMLTEQVEINNTSSVQAWASCAESKIAVQQALAEINKEGE